jgi:hypothetical protein
MPDNSDIHPNAPTGGGGPGAFVGRGPTGTNPEIDKWRSRGQLGAQPLAVADAEQKAIGGTGDPAVPATGGTATTDPDIEALDLADTAKKAAYELKKAQPTVTFTSGRRDKAGQASAMASNVVKNRTWIQETYATSVASTACQKWVDDNKDKTTAKDISQGLLGVLNGLTDAQLGALSKHLSGEAFDVQPVTEKADEIKTSIRGLTGLSKFLEMEGGLVRWHAQF